MHVKNKSNTDPADFPNMLVVRPLPTDSATSAIGCTHLAGIKWVLLAIISMVVYPSAATETGPSIYGYGSIPINTIFSGMNIHLPAILMFTRGTRFWHTAI